ncbi:MAG TPA: mechanosensitive ion channel [Bacteroidetes bacterium]|nr:mechanosensitive ion channel [Bacteroidota bacterium]
MEITIQDISALLKDVFNFTLFKLNQTPVTISSIFMFFFVLTIFFIISKFLSNTIINKLLIRFQIEEGLRFTLKRITHYLIMITGMVVAFQFVGIDLSGLAVVFGFLSVGIGFGLQNITSNFVSGLILLFERPIEIGDRITIGNTEGDVTAINMRSTTVQSLDNISIIVPNSEFISSQVVNWSHGDPKVRMVVKVGVSYNSDLSTINQALTEVALSNANVLKKPKPKIIFNGFGDSAWNMELWIWLGSPRNYYQIRSEINRDIITKFRKYRIEIPFPQTDLHVRSPLPVPFQSVTEINDKADQST